MFHKNLKAWRVFKALTQEELSRRSGVSRPNLVALEQGRRECTLSTLNRLAYAMDLSPGRLLDQQPPIEKKKMMGRHEIDLVARSLFKKRISLPSNLLVLRQQALSQAGPLLRVAGIRDTSRTRKVNPQYQEVIEQILRRISKLAPFVFSGGAL